VRDPYGQKMSKTKGNVVDPLETIDTYGADALRFALVHGTAPGADSRLGPIKLENARNFANKLWNAARFVLGARPAWIPADAERRLPGEGDLGPADRWIRSRTAATISAVDRAMADFQFGEVTRLLYEAVWSEYCDWYLELAKIRLADEALPQAAREATWWNLVEMLDTYLRLLHPVMPFVTEAIWSRTPHRATDPDLLIVARWPAPAERDGAVEAEVEAVLELVRAIRNARTEAKLEPGVPLALDVHVPGELGGTFEALRSAVGRLARVRPIERRLAPEALEPARAAGGLSILAGPIEAVLGRPAVDEGAAALEAERLARELAEAERLLGAARARLANEDFVRKAPASVVEGARDREAELAEQVDRLRSRLG
jgi:valyl-tRNA synthetase